MIGKMLLITLERPQTHFSFGDPVPEKAAAVPKVDLPPPAEIQSLAVAMRLSWGCGPCPSGAIPKIEMRGLFEKIVNRWR